MLIKRLKKDGSFAVANLIESQGRFSGYSLLSGQAGKLDQATAKEFAIDEERSAQLVELYRGPDDPRLPDDVKAMTIGKREDFVDAFNMEFWWYEKKYDPDYDENQPVGVNSVRFCLKKGYAAVAGTSSGGASEGVKEKSLKTTPRSTKEQLVTESGKTAYRIKEEFVGIILPKSTKEAAGDDEDVSVIIIEKGWSLNDRYYTDQALKDITEQVTQRRAGFMNHGNTFSRDPRDWAIMVHSAEQKPKYVQAKMHVFDEPDGPFLQERISKAPELFGGSIDAFVVMEDGEIEGQAGEIVTEVALLNCWDIVMFPGAGGRVMAEAKEGAPKNQPKEKETPKNNAKKEKNTMDLETLKRDHSALFALICKEAVESVSKEYEQKLTAEQAKTAEANGKVATLTTENVTLKAKVDEYQTLEAKEQWKLEVKKMVEEGLEEDQRSEGFTSILIDLGKEKVELAKQMIAERKVSMAGRTMPVGETDATKGLKEQKSTGKPKSDEDELEALRKRKVA